MDDFASTLFGCLFVILLILIASHTTAVLVSSVAVLWESDKWSCTDMLYPSPEKKETFSPYCTQWSIEK